MTSAGTVKYWAHSSIHQSGTDGKLKSLEPLLWSTTDPIGCPTHAPPCHQSQQLQLNLHPHLSGTFSFVTSSSNSSNSSSSNFLLSHSPLNNSYLWIIILQVDDLSDSFWQMGLAPGFSWSSWPILTFVPAPNFLPVSSASELHHGLYRTSPFIHSTSNYSTPNHTPPTQQALPPQGYIQPPQQIQVSYYPLQHFNSNHQYRPFSQYVQHLPQPSQ